MEKHIKELQNDTGELKTNQLTTNERLNAIDKSLDKISGCLEGLHSKLDSLTPVQCRQAESARVEARAANVETTIEQPGSGSEFDSTVYPKAWEQALRLVSKVAVVDDLHCSFVAFLNIDREHSRLGFSNVPQVCSGVILKCYPRSVWLYILQRKFLSVPKCLAEKCSTLEDAVRILYAVFLATQYHKGEVYAAGDSIVDSEVEDAKIHTLIPDSGP